MGARIAEWHLLDYESDPAPGDLDGIDDAIRYFATISDALITQGALMGKIGDGDETLLKGVSADAMRKRARESAEMISKAANRYVQMHDAISTYRPALETVRSETLAAVTDASNSVAGQQSAERMPDPAGTQRAEGDPPVTPDEEQQSGARKRAIEQASGLLADAKSRAQRAMEAFDVAAEAAARTIRHNWNVDGLHSSDWDKFVYGLNQFLKKLVEILGYIGMALAIIGLAISGVGIIAILGLVATVVSLVANIILAAQGEASWLGVILGVVAIVTVGLGALASSFTKAAQAAAIGRGGQVLAREVPRLTTQLRNIEKAKAYRPNFSRPFTVPNFSRPLSSTNAFRRPPPTNVGGPIGPRLDALENIGTGITSNAWKPGWWQIRNMDALKIDVSKFKNIKAWNWDKVMGIDAPRNLDKLYASINGATRSGLPGAEKAKTWMFFGGPAFAWGWTTGVFGAVANGSTLAGSADTRSSWPWADAGYAGLTSERKW